MSESKVLVGLMSGTSLDGITAAELVGIVGNGRVFAQTSGRYERDLAAAFKPTHYSDHEAPQPIPSHCITGPAYTQEVASLIS